MHANICLLNKGDNTAISDQRPSVYFRDLEVRLGDKLQAVLDSNFISREAYAAGLKDDYMDFVSLRAYSIIEAANKLSGCPSLKAAKTPTRLESNINEDINDEFDSSADLDE